MNIQVQNLEIELGGLRAQQRHVTEEARDLLWQIRAKEDELQKSQEWEKHRTHRHSGKHGRRYPENEGKDFIGPLEKELGDLKNRRELRLQRIEEVQGEIGNLSGLLYRCKRHMETVQSANTPVMSVEDN